MARGRKDPLRSQEDRNALVEANVNLAWKAALRFRDTFSGDIEDLAQEAIVGLMRAAELWNAEKGHQFSTYAWRCCWSHMCRYLHQDRLIRFPSYLWHRRCIPTLKAILMSGRGEHDWRGSLNQTPDHRESQTEVFDAKEEIGPVLAAIKKLERRQREAVLDHLRGITLQETGNRLGTSKEYVRQLRNKGFEVLRSLPELQHLHQEKAS